jgi:N utilization substance protein B
MKRRKAREYALQFLYGIDFVKPDTIYKKIPDNIKDDLKNFWEEIGEKDLETKTFAEDVILGTILNINEIDTLIQKVTERWTLERMACIDRNILRFATYELLYRNDIPPVVTINEAIEIAKKYSTSESASFINGILDKIAKEYITK